MKLRGRLAKIPSSHRWYGGLNDGRNQLAGLYNREAKRFDRSSVEVVFTGYPGFFVI